MIYDRLPKGRHLCFIYDFELGMTRVQTPAKANNLSFEGEDAMT